MHLNLQDLSITFLLSNSIEKPKKQDIEQSIEVSESERADKPKKLCEI